MEGLTGSALPVFRNLGFICRTCGMPASLLSTPFLLKELNHATLTRYFVIAAFELLCSFSPKDFRRAPNRDPCSLWGLIWGLPRDIGVI